MSRMMLVLAVIVGLVQLVGCTGSLKDKSSGIPSLVLGPEAATTSPELPPDKAAIACATTGAAFEKAGKVEDAINQYVTARQHDPKGQKHVARRLAVLYDKLGDFTKSAAEYESAFQLTPNDPDLHNDYGYSCYSRGEWVKAEEHFTKATTLAPNHKRAWMNRGLAIGMQGRTDESLACFRKVVSEAEAHANLAFVLATLGQTDAAKQEYRQALSLTPELGVARAALDALENPNREKQAGQVEPKTTKDKNANRDVRVPTIQELEARLNLQPEQVKPVEIDPFKQ